MVTLGTAPDSNLPVKTGGSNISLREIVFTLFRRKWIIMVIALPIMIIGGLNLFSQTGTFTSSARVVVELIRVDLPRWNTTGRNLDYDRELSTLVNMAMSLPVAEMAANTLADSIPRIMKLDPRLVDLDEDRNFRGYLLEGLNVSIVGESTILEFQFTSVHPEISLMAVGALRDAFIHYQVFGRKNINAIVYYDEQIKTVRGEIDSLMVLRTKVLEESGYSSIKDEMRLEVGQMADVENKLYEAIANRRTLQVQYDILSGFLDKDPRLFPGGVDESRSHTLVHWRNLVAKHEDDLNSILAVHTEDSIPARRQRMMLDSALERLKQEEISYVESLRVALETARGTESALADQVAEIRTRNDRGPLAAQKVSMLDVEINSMRDLLQAVQGKRGEVRLSELADERVSSVAALTDPQMIMVLSSGKTIVYFAMIVFFGLALGIVAAFVMESMDHRVYAPKDVEENLRLPVFASVTRKD